MTTKKQKYSIFYELVALAFIGSSISTLSRYALFTVPTLVFVASRLAIVALLCFSWLKIKKIPIPLKQVKTFIFVSCFYWLNFLLFPIGLRHTTAITAQFIHIAIPVLTALLAIVILNQGLTKRQWLGVVVSMLGVGLLITSKGQLSFTSDALFGNLIVFASAISFSFYAVLSRKEKYADIHPLVMVLTAAASGFVVTLPFAIRESLNSSWWHQSSWLAFFATIGTGLIGGFFYILLQQLIKRQGPSVATLTLYLIPAFTVIWATSLLDEKLGLLTVVGGSLAFLGVWVVTSKK